MVCPVVNSCNGRSPNGKISEFAAASLLRSKPPEQAARFSDLTAQLFKQFSESGPERKFELASFHARTGNIDEALKLLSGQEPKAGVTAETLHPQERAAFKNLASQM